MSAEFKDEWSPFCKYFMQNVESALSDLLESLSFQE